MDSSKSRKTEGEHGSSRQSEFPLSALLSQMLVAFTIEFDNEFERQMAEAGGAGARVSMVVWLDLLRFVTDSGESVRNLSAQALSPIEHIKSQLGCLERWGIIRLAPDEADERPVPFIEHRRANRETRDGWGSGRGIRADWIVRLTSKGRKAAQIWSTLFETTESRWVSRFGEEKIDGLKAGLIRVVERSEWRLPLGLPPASPETVSFPARLSGQAFDVRLPVLLAQTLLSFAIEFDRRSKVPIVLCANVIRAIGNGSARVGDLARLTGGSPETSAIGWQLRPYVVIEPDPSSARGKVVRLSETGLKALACYDRLTKEIERDWAAELGDDELPRLKQMLIGMMTQTDGEGLVISKCLTPPPGVARAGAAVPALGRKDIGVAAKQRGKDLVVQTELFVRDPMGTLPHYPLWDMNRGFGP